MDSPNLLSSLAFLTVCDDNAQLVGALLLLNPYGRPLEFHCTEPVRPNRAQEILYGPTLRPFLEGEHIGRALLDQLRTAPLLVCTDRPAVLAVRPFARSAVVLLGDAAAARAGAEGVGPLSRFVLAGRPAATLAARPDDRDEATRGWEQAQVQVDPLEPFARMRAAIQELAKAA